MSAARLQIVGVGLAFSGAAAAQDETYHNPADEKDYVAPGGWQAYRPDGGVRSTAEKVSLDSVRLLQSQDELASRTSVPDLAAFIGLARQAAAEVFVSYLEPAVLLVQFTCVPGKCPAAIAYQGDPPQDLLQAYYDKLGQLQPLRCSGEVRFQFTLQVRP
jgi:hypothetical protein